MLTRSKWRKRTRENQININCKGEKNGKNFLLDTNILMSDPNALFGFEDNNVYLCGTVIQELDKHKDDLNERGYNARVACKKIKELILSELEAIPKNDRVEYLRKNGVSLPTGGRLFFEPDGVDINNLPRGYSIDKADNRIISSCVYMNKQYLKDNEVTLLTNDNNCFINAWLCGVCAEDVQNEFIEDTGYTGHVKVEIENWTLINLLREKGSMNPAEIPELEDYELLENEFVTISSGIYLIRTVYQGGMLRAIGDHPQLPEHGILPLNGEQQYAMWALTNPDIPLVILDGPAGTAKTFISLACGLEQLNCGDKRDTDHYERILISRPNAGNSDPDFGYLPGTLEEKMGPLVASYMDNLEEILGDKDTPRDETREVAEDMIDRGLIELTPLYSIRGRSIHNSYLICDEAQNATRKLIKDVVTRAGRNTKIVIAGDPSQVDAAHLDKRNNGLVYAEECMKGSPYCAIIKFENEDCVRSDLAEDAISRMK